MALEITRKTERPLIYWHNLKPKEQAEFDYLDTEEKREEAQFFRYKKCTYCLDQFAVWNTPWTGEKPAAFKDFDAIHGDSFFSGVLVKQDPEGEDFIKVASYYS